MPHYKTPNDPFPHFIEAEFAHLLPDGSVQITDEEAEALRPKSEMTYAQKRAAAYPPFMEFLDGMVKGDQEQIAKYVADCLAVKAQYPKS